MRLVKFVAATAILLLVGFFMATHSAAVSAIARHLIDGLEKAGSGAPVLYIGTVAAAVVFFLPGLFLTLGGGFLFGVIKGTAFFLAGEILGAILAFALARRVLRSRLNGYFRAHPKLGMWNEALADEGWKFIALTRMTPFFPFKASNYFFGASGFRFRDFFWGTALGTFPLSFTLVYLGSLIPDAAGLQTRKTLDLHLAHGTAVAVGIVAVGGMVWLSRRAARGYRKRVAAWERAEKKTPQRFRTR